jgi:hypothetical protein
MSGKGSLAALVAALALTPAAAQAQGTDQMTIYRHYADIREQLIDCHLEAIWDTVTPENARICRRMKRRYVLFSWPTDNWYYHLHCRSPRRCIPTPYNEPPADQPMPAGSTAYP